jgi:Flagellar biosynthesis/type III secretory pathway chaperone
LLETSWQNIQSLAEDNKTLNHSNGAMIELNRRHVQRSLEVLRGQVGKETSTYGADGQAMKSKISRNISTV